MVRSSFPSQCNFSNFYQQAPYLPPTDYQMSSDATNGQQFTSREFKSFAKDMNFTVITSSPKFPQSNGQAESGVKIEKKLLSQQDFNLALMNLQSNST